MWSRKNMEVPLERTRLKTGPCRSCQYIDIWGNKEGFSSRSVSGDIVGYFCDDGMRGISGIYWGKARDIIKQLTTDRTNPVTLCSAPNITSAKGETP